GRDLYHRFIRLGLGNREVNQREGLRSSGLLHLNGFHGEFDVTAEACAATNSQQTLKSSSRIRRIRLNFQLRELRSMPQIPNLIHLAIPAFLLLLAAEVVADAIMRRDLYQLKDMVASLSMGTGNVILGLVSKGIAFAAFTAVHRFAIFKIGYQWWAWALLFF